MKTPTHLFAPDQNAVKVLAFYSHWAREILETGTACNMMTWRPELMIANPTAQAVAQCMTWVTAQLRILCFDAWVDENGDVYVEGMLSKPDYGTVTPVDTSEMHAEAAGS